MGVNYAICMTENKYFLNFTTNSINVKYNSYLFVANYWTCSTTRLVVSQVLHFFRLKPYKNAFLQ